MECEKLKKVVFLSFFCCFSLGVLSQNLDEDEIEPKLKKDNIVVDVYTGYPMWGAYHTKEYARSQNASNISTKGIPDVGVKGEIMLTSIFSFTADALFNFWGGSWNTHETIEVFDDPTQPAVNEDVFYNYDYSVSRFRFQIGINYHMDDITVENIDLYGGVSIGTNRIWERLTTNDQNFKLEDHNYFVLTDSPLIESPISLRARIGGRYFFTPNMAVNLELNVGGPTIAMGLSYLL